MKQECIYLSICPYPEMDGINCTECEMREFGYIPEIIEETDRLFASDPDEDIQVFHVDGVDRFGAKWSWLEYVDPGYLNIIQPSIKQEFFQRVIDDDNNLKCEQDIYEDE